MTRCSASCIGAIGADKFERVYSGLKQRGERDGDEVLVGVLGGAVDTWCDVARKMASLLLCEESLSMWV